jgi:hypothetical protein
MKRSTLCQLGAGLLAYLLVGQAWAQTQCPAGGIVGTTRVTGDLAALLSGKTMCARNANHRWQEFHKSDRDLIDYKMGPNHAMDPTEKVGTWSTVNGSNATVTHNYLGGTTYTWQVCKTSSSPDLYMLISTQGAPTLTNVTLLNGQVPCP